MTPLECQHCQTTLRHFQLLKKASIEQVGIITNLEAEKFQNRETIAKLQKELERYQSADVANETLSMENVNLRAKLNAMKSAHDQLALESTEKDSLIGDMSGKLCQLEQKIGELSQLNKSLKNVIVSQSEDRNCCNASSQTPKSVRPCDESIGQIDDAVSNAVHPDESINITRTIKTALNIDNGGLGSVECVGITGQPIEMQEVMEVIEDSGDNSSDSGMTLCPPLGDVAVPDSAVGSCDKICGDDESAKIGREEVLGSGCQPLVSSGDKLALSHDTSESPLRSNVTRGAAAGCSSRYDFYGSGDDESDVDMAQDRAVTGGVLCPPVADDVLATGCCGASDDDDDDSSSVSGFSVATLYDNIVDVSVGSYGKIVDVSMALGLPDKSTDPLVAPSGHRGSPIKEHLANEVVRAADRSNSTAINNTNDTINNTNATINNTNATINNTNATNTNTNDIVNNNDGEIINYGENNTKINNNSNNSNEKINKDSNKINNIDNISNNPIRKISTTIAIDKISTINNKVVLSQTTPKESINQWCANKKDSNIVTPTSAPTISLSLSQCSAIEEARAAEIEMRTRLAHEITAAAALSTEEDVLQKKLSGVKKLINQKNLASDLSAKQQQSSVFSKFKNSMLQQRRGGSNYSMDMRPLNRENLVMERMTKQDLMSSKIAQVTTDSISGTKRTRIDDDGCNAERKKSKVSMIKGPTKSHNGGDQARGIGKEGTQGGVGSRLVNVNLGQLLVRNNISDSDIERFQQMTTFTSCNPILPEVTAPPMPKTPIISVVMPAAVVTPAAVVATPIAAPVPIVLPQHENESNDNQHRSFDDTIGQVFTDLLDKTDASAFEIVVKKHVVIRGETEAKGFVNGLLQFFRNHKDEAFKRDYVIQVVCCIIRVIIMQYQKIYSYYYDCLLSFMKSVGATLGSILTLALCNISFYATVGQWDFVMMFLVDLMRLPTVPVLMVISVITPSAVFSPAVTGKHAALIAVMKRVVLYEYSTTREASAKKIIDNFPVDIQQFWLSGSTSQNVTLSTDLEPVLELIRQTIVAYKSIPTKVKLNELDKDIENKYKK